MEYIIKSDFDFKDISTKIKNLIGYTNLSGLKN
jgi:hypothetical protein